VTLLPFLRFFKILIVMLCIAIPARPGPEAQPLHIEQVGRRSQSGRVQVPTTQEKKCFGWKALVESAFCLLQPLCLLQQPVWYRDSTA
jgi:hypothetical protein